MRVDVLSILVSHGVEHVFVVDIFKLIITVLANTGAVVDTPVFLRGERLILLFFLPEKEGCVPLRADLEGLFGAWRAGQVLRLRVERRNRMRFALWGVITLLCVTFVGRFGHFHLLRLSRGHVVVYT